MVTRAKKGIFKPKIYLTKHVIEGHETFKQAIQHTEWKRAMEEEYQALIRNNTCCLVPMPKDKSIRNVDGHIS